MDIRALPDERSAAEAAARAIATRLRNAVRHRGRASLAVSGGGTPALMFDALAALPVPWSSVDVLQVDERIVPKGSPDRNATSLDERLIEALTAHRPRVHLLPVEDAADEDAVRAAGALVERLAPIDVVHLGIGADGHTASWPPGDPVAHAPDPVARTGVFNGFARLTLTSGPVNGARSRIVLVCGSAKAPAVARWIRGDESLPISGIRQRSTMVVLDAAAAADIEGGVAALGQAPRRR